jgi:hypothetical protein
MEITFETEETVVLREGAKVVVEHCPECGQSVLMGTPQAAAFLSGVSERELFRRVELSLVHFTEKGRVMICFESLNLIGKEIRLEINEPDKEGYTNK